MQQDLNGWGAAPAASHWHCPECGAVTPVADWAQGATPDTRLCPACGFEYTAGPVPDGQVRHHELGSSMRISGHDTPRPPGVRDREGILRPAEARP